MKAILLAVVCGLGCLIYVGLQPYLLRRRLDTEAAAAGFVPDCEDVEAKAACEELEKRCRWGEEIAKCIKLPPIKQSVISKRIEQDGAKAVLKQDVASKPTPVAGINELVTAGPARCSKTPLVVIGLWILTGNAKHKPSFFTSRVYNTLKIIGSHSKSVVLFAGGEENSKGKLSSQQANTAFLARRKKKNKVTEAAFSYKLAELDSLPYKAQADAVPADCPAKYGKKLPKGQLRMLDKVWLSKIALVDQALQLEPDEGCPANGAGRSQWLWLDAGLEKDQVLRILNHTKVLQRPQPGAIHLQFYCEAKMLQAKEYFAGRCPVRHLLNAKAFWGDRQGFKSLRAAFDQCLNLLVADIASKKCDCFDEETVMTHIVQGLAPCHIVPKPTFVPMPVIAKCS